MKTIREIAEEIGVSRQAVYQKIKKEPLKSALQSHLKLIDNKTLVDSEGENLIIQAFPEEPVKPIVKTSQPMDSNLDSALIDSLQDTISLLKHQLEVKDNQIQGLQDTISDLSAALAASQALHAGTIRQTVLPEPSQPSQPVSEPSGPVKKHSKLYNFFFNE